MWDDWYEGRLKDLDLTPTELSFARGIVDKFDSNLVDPFLSHIGINQSIAAQPTINQLPIKYVLVSPIHRTLETASLLFETHPNRGSIKFIVLPLIREIMANPDDIPAFTLNRLKDKYESHKDLHFDFSLVENSRNKLLYFLETMDEEVRDRVLDEVHRSKEEEYINIMLNVMRDKWIHLPHHKKKIESFDNGRKRGHNFSQWVTQEFMREKGVSGNEIMVVSHSVFLSHLVAQEFNDYGKAVCPKIKNAEPFLFDLNTVIPFKS
jgi:broad specificity phosphatase PhoE